MRVCYYVFSLLDEEKRKRKSCFIARSVCLSRLDEGSPSTRRRRPCTPISQADESLCCFPSPCLCRLSSSSLRRFPHFSLFAPSASLRLSQPLLIALYAIPSPPSASVVLSFSRPFETSGLSPLPSTASEQRDKCSNKTRCAIPTQRKRVGSIRGRGRWEGEQGGDEDEWGRQLQHNGVGGNRGARRGSRDGGVSSTGA
jgi:hypothetical protein